MVFQSILTTLLFILCFNYCFINILAEEESFYTLLGVDQDVDLLTIRKAFKRLAILKHPDKNPHDPDAHSLFVRINRAYEVLKDDDLRQKYDQFGEKGLEDNGGGDHQYQSWQFYNDNFGIYDEDPEIITLGRGDFEEVFQSGEIWFVNFYSAYCSHCHTLAPVWRELAKRVPEGVARIGAVNCAEDPQLCRSQNVMGYPSLIVYPQQEWFEGERKLDNLLNFLLSQISVSILQPTHALPPQRPLLLELCLFNENDCLSEEERKKIAAISNQLLIQFVLLDCSGFAKELCNTFGAQEGMFLLSGDENEKPKELYFADLTDLRLQLLSELPELDELTSVEFNQLLNRKNINTDQESTLIIFINSKEEEQKEWRRLPIIFPQIDVKIVNCFVKDIKHLCDNMHLGKLPRSAIFKSNGGYDLNYGNVQTNIREIIKFIRHSLNSNLIVLNYDTYWEARQSANSSDLWLIDHFATWCPPCIKMLDELRKLNSELNEGLRLHIGTIDCDAFRGICSQERINSYPRTMLFTGDSNQKQQHSLVGFHTVDQLLEFISEALNPSVETLTPDNFDQIVYSSGHSFFIDFFAPWCGPCQKLAPEFRQLARQWAATHKQQQNPIVFASVDCEEYSGLCNRENVHSFPALRLYRQINEGGKIDIIHYPSNWWRNAQTMSHWLSEMMPSLVQKIAGDFANTVLDSSEPFLIDFYAPWCSHCVQFAPVFEQLAQLLNGKIRLGKVDCERFSWICSNAQVNYFPQILLYFGTNKYKRQNSRGIEIEHGMDAEIIAKNVIEKLEEYGNLNERDEL